MTSKNKKHPLEKHLTSSIVNLNYINEYLDGEKEPTIKVIQIFIEQAYKIMEKLEKGILSKNYQDIIYTAHFFKSSFTTMGINCYDEIQQIESLGRQNASIDKISKTLNIMMPKFNEAIQEYESLLDKLR